MYGWRYASTPIRSNAAVGGSQRVAAIGDDDFDVVELVQRKVFAGDVIDLGVDLDARDRDWAVRGGEFPGDRATRQPDQ